MRLQFDFAAPASKHFGLIQPLSDQVLAMPGALDVWLAAATPDNMTLIDGGVSEWRGRRNGRRFEQGNAARRPRPENGLLRYSSDIQSPQAQLDLTGAMPGPLPAFTIASKQQIHPEQLGADNQYFWGTAVGANLFRLAYRFTNGTRYLRIQVGGTSTNLDVPLPLNWSGVIGTVAVVQNGTLALYHSLGSEGSRAMPSVMDLQSLTIANTVVNANGGLRGYVGDFGMWTRAVTPEEHALLLRWVT